MPAAHGRTAAVLCACILAGSMVNPTAGADVVVVAVGRPLHAVNATAVTRVIEVELDAAGGVRVVGVVSDAEDPMMSRVLLSFQRSAFGESALSIAQRFMTQAALPVSSIARLLDVRPLPSTPTSPQGIAACGAAGVAADGLRVCTLPGSALPTDAAATCRCRLLDIKAGIIVVAVLVCVTFALLWVLLLLLSRSGGGGGDVDVDVECAPSSLATARSRERLATSKPPSETDDGVGSSQPLRPPQGPSKSVTHSTRGARAVLQKQPRSALADLPANVAGGVPAGELVAAPPKKSTMKGAPVGGGGGNGSMWGARGGGGSKGPLPPAGAQPKAPPPGAPPQPQQPPATLLPDMQHPQPLPRVPPPAHVQRDFSYIPDRIDSPEMMVGELAGGQSGWPHASVMMLPPPADAPVHPHPHGFGGPVEIWEDGNDGDGYPARAHRTHGYERAEVPVDDRHHRHHSLSGGGHYHDGASEDGDDMSDRSVSGARGRDYERERGYDYGRGREQQQQQRYHGHNHKGVEAAGAGNVDRHQQRYAPPAKGVGGRGRRDSSASRSRSPTTVRDASRSAATTEVVGVREDAHDVHARHETSMDAVPPRNLGSLDVHERQGAGGAGRVSIAATSPGVLAPNALCDRDPRDRAPSVSSQDSGHHHISRLNLHAGGGGFTQRFNGY